MTGTKEPYVEYEAWYIAYGLFFCLYKLWEILMLEQFQK